MPKGQHKCQIGRLRNRVTNKASAKEAVRFIDCVDRAVEQFRESSQALRAFNRRVTFSSGVEPVPCDPHRRMRVLGLLRRLRRLSKRLHWSPHQKEKTAFQGECPMRRIVKLVNCVQGLREGTVGRLVVSRLEYRNLRALRHARRAIGHEGLHSAVTCAHGCGRRNQ